MELISNDYVDYSLLYAFNTNLTSLDFYITKIEATRRQEIPIFKIDLIEDKMQEIVAENREITPEVVETRSSCDFLFLNKDFS